MPRANYDNDRDHVCTSCSKGLSPNEGVGYLLDGIAGPLCGKCYRDLKKQLQDKKDKK